MFSNTLKKLVAEDYGLNQTVDDLLKRVYKIILDRKYYLQPIEGVLTVNEEMVNYSPRLADGLRSTC
jgi:hypothetical protein